MKLIDVSIKVLPPLLRNADDSRLRCLYDPTCSPWHIRNAPIAVIIVEDEIALVHMFVGGSAVVVVVVRLSSVVTHPFRVALANIFTVICHSEAVRVTWSLI